MGNYDVAVVGGGVMGCSTALYLSRNRMRTIVIDRGALCREASGTNAGTLTLNMTRAALIPYAIKGWELWNSTEKWLHSSIGTRKVNGLSLAFTEEEEELLYERVQARQAMGAPIKLISGKKAQRLEPGLNNSVRSAAWCAKDGFTSAYLTGQAFKRALTQENSAVMEYSKVKGIENDKNNFKIYLENNEHLIAKRIVLAGGVWLEDMLSWLNVKIPIKCLINQLIITERMPQVMKTVLSIANGLLSMKQFDKNTVKGLTRVAVVKIKKGLFGGGIISDKRYVVILLGPEISHSNTSEIVAICTDHAGLSGFATEYFEYLLKDASEVK